MLNIAGISHYLTHQELWSLNKCRYCLESDEIDTFYVYYCSNKVIFTEQEEIFNRIFDIIININCSIDVKEILLCALLKQNYTLPQYLQEIYQLLLSFGLRLL